MNRTSTKQKISHDRVPKISILWLIIPLAALVFTILWNPKPKVAAVAQKNNQIESTPATATGDYSYIDPHKADYRPFMQDVRNSTRKLVESEIKKGNATAVSVYFESLPTGLIYSYNNNSWYSPASLLKVTVLMTYLKKSETSPGLLNKKVVYHKTGSHFTQNFLNDSLIDGHTYTNRQLLEHLIVSSENDAASLLVSNCDPKDLAAVFNDFNIEIESNTTIIKDYMPIEKYMFLLRSLYKSSYLTKENSEYALKLLTRSDFNSGIRAGIPSGIKVASKFGERGYNNVLQLHDCGIVYYGNTPYLLGIMTKGKDFNAMEKTIQSVSAEIFDVVRRDGALAQDE